jgi:hypothetical protein
VVPNTPPAPRSNQDISKIVQEMASAYHLNNLHPQLSSEFTLSPTQWKVNNRGALGLKNVGHVFPGASVDVWLSSKTEISLELSPLRNGMVVVDCTLDMANDYNVSVSIRVDGMMGPPGSANYSGVATPTDGHLTAVFPVTNIESGHAARASVKFVKVNKTNPESGRFHACRIVPAA